jgi:exoribonuclease R
MILANAAVAEKIAEVLPTASLLRRHQAPSLDAFRPLLSAAQALGLEVSVGVLTCECKCG